METITQSQLKNVLNYNPDTGIFTWLKDRARLAKKGDIAGHTINKNGYMYIRVLGSGYYMHRLAFLYVNGVLPGVEVDHINHIRNDNRWCNLRLATSTENMKNKKLYSSNASGVAGVHWHRFNKKWTATIKVNKKVIHLGYFKDKNEAICARLHANRLYQFHANHGK